MSIKTYVRMKFIKLMVFRRRWDLESQPVQFEKMYDQIIIVICITASGSSCVLLVLGRGRI